jgi:hypothetical protein
MNLETKQELLNLSRSLILKLTEELNEKLGQIHIDSQNKDVIIEECEEEIINKIYERLNQIKKL